MLSREASQPLELERTLACPRQGRGEESESAPARLRAGQRPGEARGSSQGGVHQTSSTFRAALPPDHSPQNPKVCVCVCPLHCGVESVSHSVVSDSATPWTVAPQSPLSMGFPRQEYWSGLPFASPEDLPKPGIPHCGQILYPLSQQRSP